MSVNALTELRDEIGAVLLRKADALKQELKAIGADYAEVGRIALYGRRSTKGRKVPPKYRGPDGETWAGRGATPRWLTAAIKAGKKREDFLIAKRGRPAKAKRKAGRKKRR
jgi:DNA-binding protein H-NS